MKLYKIINIIEKIKWWFYYRFFPKHRYHVIKLGDPGYYEFDEAVRLSVSNLFLEHYPHIRGFMDIDPDVEKILDDCHNYFTHVRKELSVLLEDVWENTILINDIDDENRRWVRFAMNLETVIDAMDTYYLIAIIKNKHDCYW